MSVVMKGNRRACGDGSIRGVKLNYSSARCHFWETCVKAHGSLSIIFHNCMGINNCLKIKSSIFKNLVCGRVPLSTGHLLPKCTTGFVEALARTPKAQTLSEDHARPAGV